MSRFDPIKSQAEINEEVARERRLQRQRRKVGQVMFFSGIIFLQIVAMVWVASLSSAWPL